MAHIWLKNNGKDIYSDNIYVIQNGVFVNGFSGYVASADCRDVNSRSRTYYVRSDWYYGICYNDSGRVTVKYFSCAINIDFNSSIYPKVLQKCNKLYIQAIINRGTSQSAIVGVSTGSDYKTGNIYYNGSFAGTDVYPTANIEITSQFSVGVQASGSDGVSRGCGVGISNLYLYKG